jgi:hypothetical protein
MKIRTIIGLLLVLALVLGSTGVGATECVPIGGGPHGVPYEDDQGGPHQEDCPDCPNNNIGGGPHGVPYEDDQGGPHQEDCPDCPNNNIGGGPHGVPYEGDQGGPHQEDCPDCPNNNNIDGV